MDNRMPVPRPGHTGAARRVAWWTVLGLVLLGHAAATLWLQSNLVGWGDANPQLPARMEVAFVQPLAPAAPPAAPPARTARQAAPARAAAPAASAALPTTVAVAPSAEPPTPAAVVSVEPAIAPEVSELASAAPVAVPEPAASAPSAASVAFEWPPSTLLSYILTGNYRGEVHGSARVQWVRQGPRYQVHIDIAIGPHFAPLISRRMTSDGELGEGGLVPGRYDEATRLPFQRPRRATILFSPDQVTLANGSQHPALAGVQDAASQFVQLTWLFTQQPELLREGNTVTLALALPRRTGRWVYDVVGKVRLATPVGELDTFHLKPRLGERRPGNELSAEIWFAPTLQYLPVRIRLQQEVETFVDLMLDAAPLQAAAPSSAPR